MKLRTWFSLKAPIQGVSFSNEEVGLEVETEVEDKDWATTKELLTEQVKAITKDYFDKLASELEDGQSEVIEKLQVEMSKQYEDKLKLASKEIYKLRDLLKDNGISYN